MLQSRHLDNLSRVRSVGGHSLLSLAHPLYYLFVSRLIHKILKFAHVSFICIVAGEIFFCGSNSRRPKYWTHSNNISKHTTGHITAFAHLSYVSSTYIKYKYTVKSIHTRTLNANNESPFAAALAFYSTIANTVTILCEHNHR